MRELWDLLLTGQNESSGIPPALITEKQNEKKKKMEQLEEARR